MLGYRYLQREYALALVERGALRLATTGSVKSLPTGLQDHTDGAVEMLLNERFRVEPGSDAYWQLMRHGIQIDGGVNVTMADTRLRQSVAGWILCMTDSARSDHFASVASAQDTVVEIRDLETVAELVAASMLPGMTVGAPQVGTVEYQQRRFDRLCHTPDPNPFIKHSSYSAEREVRIFWPSASQRPKVLDLTVPEIVEFVRIV